MNRVEEGIIRAVVEVLNGSKRAKGYPHSIIIVACVDRACERRKEEGHRTSVQLCNWLQDTDKRCNLTPSGCSLSRKGKESCE